MKRQIDMVGTFHRKFKQPIEENPAYVFPDDERMEMRQRILQEEVDELRDAIKAKDPISIVDAMTDIAYVMFGTAHELGVAKFLPDAFREVHESNMRKLVGGKPILREDGKILKPEGWQPPNLKDIVYPAGKLPFKVGDIVTRIPSEGQYGMVFAAAAGVVGVIWSDREDMHYYSNFDDLKLSPPLPLPATRFNLGTPVQWVTCSNGKVKRHTGTIIKRVEPHITVGQAISEMQTEPSQFTQQQLKGLDGWYQIKFLNRRIWHNHSSYLVAEDKQYKLKFAHKVMVVRHPLVTRLREIK